MTEPGAPSLQQPPSTSDADPPAHKQLLRHALVDEARRALPSAGPSAARSGAMGAGAGADRAAAVGSMRRGGEIGSVSQLRRPLSAAKSRWPARWRMLGPAHARRLPMAAQLKSAKRVSCP